MFCHALHHSQKLMLRMPEIAFILQSNYHKQMQLLSRRLHLNATTTTAASTQALKAREHIASNGFCADIITLSKDGRLKEAMAFLQQDSTDMNPCVFASLLQACTRAEGLTEGKHVHTYIIKTGFKPDTFLWNNILNMYAKCRCLKDARQVFDKMSQRSVVSWTAMITAYAQHGRAEEALRLFDQMQIEGIEPNHYTFSGVVKACSSLAALQFGRHVHDIVIRTGFQSDVVVMNALVDMYAKCGCVESARKVFDKMLERNAVSWNTMIAGYCQKGNIEEALKLFWQIPQPDVISWNVMIAGFAQNELEDEALRLFCQMRELDMKPDKFTFASVLRACAGLAALEHGKQIHAYIVVIGLESDVSGITALVDMYAKCTSLDDASKLFNKMSKEAVVANPVMIGLCGQNWHPDGVMELEFQTLKSKVVSWNAMVAGYAQNGRGEEALKLFRQMQQENLELDHFTFGSVLRACSSLLTIENGKQVHAHIIKTGNEADFIVGSALVDMYAKCKVIGDACKVFEMLSNRDTITWTTIIVSCAQHGWNKVSLQLIKKMVQGGVKPDQFTIAGGLKACANLAALEQGKQFHSHFIISGFDSDDVVGSALIDMYSKCGSIVDAHMVSDEMHSRNVVPQTAKVGGGIQHGRGDVVVRSALIDMYSKCGNIENAFKVFGKMHQRDVVSWTAMIAGLAQHGRGAEAIQLFREMLSAGMKPNEITFVGVLSACSHGGLVDQGYYYFDTMGREYGIIPRAEHYSCMVDLLGRAGYLEEAENFIAKMPVEPDASVWGTLLGACMVHGNIVLGKHAAECLLELKQDASTYVILANIYAAEGRWDDAAKVRNMMKDRGIKKQPGCSWIQIKNKVHTFVAGDMAHLQNDKICAMLDSMAGQIKQSVCRPDLEFLLHDIE